MTGTSRPTPTQEYRGDVQCSLAKAVGVVGERWTFFVLREALVGVTRFSEFRSRLGVAPDVLTTRLATLVGAGLMERGEYRDPGSRPRPAYHLTEAGRQMALAIGALQQWGDSWTPSSLPTSVEFRDQQGRAVRAAFVGPGGEVAPDEVRAVRASASGSDAQ